MDGSRPSDNSGPADADLLRALYPRLLGYALALTRSLPDAEDVVHNSLIRYWRRSVGTTIREPFAYLTSSAPLYLRSIVVLPDGLDPGSVGFVAPRLPTDEPAIDEASMIAVALLNPRDAGKSASIVCSLFSPALTDNPNGGSNQNADGLIESPLMTGAGPWNTMVAVDGQPVQVALGGAPGDRSPGTTTVISLDAAAGRGVVRAGADMHPGDAVVTAAGLVGIVTSIENGLATVDTDLTHTATSSPGTLQIYLSQTDVRISGSESAYEIAPTPGSGSRIVLTGDPHGQYVVSVGTVTTPPGTSDTTSPPSGTSFDRSVDLRGLHAGDTVMYLDLQR